MSMCDGVAVRRANNQKLSGLYLFSKSQNSIFDRANHGRLIIFSLRSFSGDSSFLIVELEKLGGTYRNPEGRNNPVLLLVMRRSRHFAAGPNVFLYAHKMW